MDNKTDATLLNVFTLQKDTSYYVNKNNVTDYQQITDYLEGQGIIEPKNNTCGLCKPKQGLCGWILSCVTLITTSLLHVPCLIWLFFTRIVCSCGKKKTKAKEKKTSVAAAANHCLMGNENCLEVNNFQMFWGAGDITTEEEMMQYRKRLTDFLNDCSIQEVYTHTLLQELKHALINAFSNRLQCMVDVIHEHKLCENVQLQLHIIKLLHSFVIQQKCSQIFHTLNNQPKFTEKLSMQVISSMRLDEDEVFLIHKAVIRRDNKFLCYILELMDEDLRYKVVNTALGNVDLKDVCCIAELPLNLAVWLGDTDMVKTLIENGAEMCAQDCNGYNCFHVVSLSSERPSHTACDMFRALMSLVSLWVEKTKTCAFLRDLCPSTREILAHLILLKSSTTRRLTPLTVAASVGCRGLVSEFMNVKYIYKHSSPQYSLKSTAWYDMTEIDPAFCSRQGKPSVLEFLVWKYNSCTLHALCHPVISEVMKSKDHEYRLYMAALGVFHVFFMITYNTAAYINIFPYIHNNGTQGINATGSPEYNSHRFDMKWVDWFALVVAGIYTPFIFLCASTIHHMARRYGIYFPKYYFLHDQ